MTSNFKICGEADVTMLLNLVKPVIKIMRDNDLSQYGFKGRVINNEIDYGEGRPLTRKHHIWTEWRPGFEDQQLLTCLSGITDAVDRIRLMRLKPFRCYSWHYDTTPRIHIPLITSKQCFLVVEQESKHLECGNIWWVDTTKYHTAVNGSDRERYHLVYEVIGPNNGFL